MLTISVVLYNTPAKYLKELIILIRQITLPFKCYFFDNSPCPKVENLIPKSSEFISSFRNGNIGFGRTHNLLFNKAIKEGTYHLILNLDVFFNSGTIETIIHLMNKNHKVGLLLPRVLNPDGSEQPLFKLLLNTRLTYEKVYS